MHIHFAALSLCCIPAVNLIVDGGRALFAKVEVVVSNPGDMRGKQDETSETGASTTWPHPIVQTGITRLVIVSSCLMSLADSGHVLGEGKGGAGNCENPKNVRLICKGNGVDIKHGYCTPPNPPSLIPIDVLSFF